MDKKKIIFISIIGIFIVLSLYSPSIIIDHPIHTDLSEGERLYAFNKGMASIPVLDRESSFLRETSVGGAICSLEPDEGPYDWEPEDKSLTKHCFENENFRGIVVQMFDVTFGNWRPLGDRKIGEGQEGCYNIQRNHKYVYQIYHCDHNIDQACYDSDHGSSFKEYGEVKIVGGLIGKKILKDRCVGNILQERECGIDETAITNSVDCTREMTRGVCNNGQCEIADPKCTLYGARDCFSNNVYSVDSCGNRVKLEEFCDPSKKICKNGACRVACIADQVIKCHDGNVHYFDTCNNPGEVVDTCNVDEVCVLNKCVHESFIPEKEIGLMEQIASFFKRLFG